MTRPTTEEFSREIRHDLCRRDWLSDEVTCELDDATVRAQEEIAARRSSFAVDESYSFFGNAELPFLPAGHEEQVCSVLEEMRGTALVLQLCVPMMFR